MRMRELSEYHTNISYKHIIQADYISISFKHIIQTYTTNIVQTYHAKISFKHSRHTHYTSCQHIRHTYCTNRICKHMQTSHNQRYGTLLFAAQHTRRLIDRKLLCKCATFYFDNCNSDRKQGLL